MLRCPRLVSNLRMELVKYRGNDEMERGTERRKEEEKKSERESEKEK